MRTCFESWTLQLRKSWTRRVAARVQRGDRRWQLSLDFSPDASLAVDAMGVHPFTTYVLRKYYQATGWNEDNLFSNLTRSSDGQSLSFPNIVTCIELNDVVAQPS